MAKKYSSLRSLASGSGTPYGVKKDNTSNSNTFNLPSVIETIPSSKSRGGKSIHDYVSRAATSSSLGPCTSAKHITISGGEYRRGSFDIGSNSKDSFRAVDKYPSAIYVNKYVGITGIDPNYSSVDSIEDMGGTYVNSSGTTVNYTLSQGAILLTGNDTDNPNTVLETLVLVYSGGDLAPYAGKRTIKVNFSDGTSVTFPDVVIPGWKNNTGIGENLTAWTSGSSATQMMVHPCSNHNESYTTAHSQLGNINNNVSPLFVYPNEMYNLTVTNLGTHHDNTGLWNEGFQPDDNLTGGSSFATNAHQETWPLGLFYKLPTTEHGWGAVSTSAPMFGNYNLSVSEMWDAQYNGSELTNISTPASERGNPLKADSVQHYKLIQGQVLRQAALTPTRNFTTQWQSTQNEYFMGNLSGLTNTNTADDGGAWYAQIETEMMAGIGSIWHDSSLTYSTHEGGATDGLIGNPGNTKVTPSFQSVQIYTESIQCASCNPTTTGSTPIDMCTNPSNPNYYLYTGVDCTGAAIPVGLMNGTETWGPNGSTGYTYELVASPTCTSCGCSGPLSVYNPSVSSAVPVPDFSLTNINAPTTLGGNDGWADIEINPALSGSEAWVYFVEPMANTNAGLGVGAIHSATIVSGGSGGTNGMFQYEYTSGSTAGSGAKVAVEVTGGVVTTLDAILKRGQEYVVGETLTFTSSSSSHTFTLQVQNVRGVVVSIQGTGTSNGLGNWFENPHEGTGADATFSNGLKATIGTNVVLAHVGGSATTNNYGNAPYLFTPSAVNNVPGLPFKRVDFFDDLAFDTTTANSTVITGMESGQYLVTIQEGTMWEPGTRTYGCFTQEILTIPPGVSSTNGCTDNNSGTNDGVALNYDANATVDDDSCIYCRAADGKLVDFQSTELTVSGSNEPGDIFTSTNNSTTVASTTSVATDGSIAYTRTLNSIMNYYTGQIVDANGTANAEFKMELYSCVSSTQTLTGASQVGATVTTPTNVGFNYDFDSINWSQGLTYGYYAIKSYVDDPDSASEQEQCFQVDYFIVPVLACITGLPGMQVGITTDNVTITDLDLVVASIPGNNLNPCSTQCCDDPTATVGYAQNSSIPGCADPYFNVLQTCPAGNNQYITTLTGEVQKLINGVWTTIFTNVDSTPGPFSQNNLGSYTYVIFVYWQYGPGDYRVNRILDYTWPNGTTSQCEAPTNVINLNSPICGCTDPNSLNFNPLATIDDGSCTYCVDGCMDQNALNYNSLATCPAPCTFCIYGCMDPAANNYNSAATCDDGSCLYGVGCGCTDILADNYGEDCGGNIVGYPPPCDDGCCSYGGAFCANPPSISTVTTEATCDPACGPGAIGCTANLNGVAGGPGYFSIDLDFGTDKGVCILTFNTGISVPDKLGWSFDIDNSGIQTTRSEQSALVGGYLTGLTGTADVPAHGCADCSGYATPQTVTEYVYSASSGNFVSTNSTVNLPAYGGNSTGDVTLSDWAVAGAAVPNKGNTPNYLTVFNDDGYVNKNSIAYIPVSPSTTATTAKVFVEAPCSSTNWYLTIRCPELLTGISSSVSAGVGGDPSSLGLTTTIYHIPIDEFGADNPNSAYYTGTGFGTGQLAGTLGKHDWVFTDPYGENKLPAGNYLMESPVGSGITWDVTVGVPTYNDDANCAAPPSGSTQDGVVLMMGTVSPANPCVGTTSIPDSNWETVLIAQGLDSGPVDGSISNANICNEFMISAPSAGITNITGIEGFVSVEAVHLQGNNITSIDFPALGVGVSLSSIHVANNSNLTTLVLPTSSNYMVNINAGGCALTTLDASNQPQLTHVRINGNNFTTVGSSGLVLTNSPNIWYIKMHNNNISGTVDLSANLVTDLLNATVVYCQDNNISELNLGDTIDLAELAAQDSGGLERFDARNNNSSLVIKVGSLPRKAQAQALFIVGTHIDATTTFSEL